jgi:hypothetical protein
MWRSLTAWQFESARKEQQGWIRKFQVAQRSDQVDHRLVADTVVTVEDVKNKRVEVSIRTDLIFANGSVADWIGRWWRI